MGKQSPADLTNQWAAVMEDFNGAVAESFERNMHAQAAFMESWVDAVEDSVPEAEHLQEAVESNAQAYEVWMDAADQLYERGTDMAKGEDVDATELRDIWLRSANQAFKEVMGTSAFAAANGQLVEAMMDLRAEADEINEDTVARLGFPTRSDVEEVGERLVELERRQHAVEEKLDRILDHLADQDE